MNVACRRLAGAAEAGDGATRAVSPAKAIAAIAAAPRRAGARVEWIDLIRRA